MNDQYEQKIVEILGINVVKVFFAHFASRSEFITV